MGEHSLRGVFRESRLCLFYDNSRITEKYLRDILKYVRHILNYLRDKFIFLPKHSECMLALYVQKRHKLQYGMYYNDLDK